MLVIFGGLPGTGKSTIARQLAERLRACYLRIDTIEEAIRTSGVLAPGAEVGPAGYITTYRLAADNLRMGACVVADSVNPLKITRDAFREVAERAGVAFLEVETICSDVEEHRRRVEERSSDTEGHTPPSWEAVRTRRYEAWDRPRLQIDTATSPIAQSVDRIIQSLPRR
ncbi:AAA family ATPase [Neorhizobium huautlense]|uniref:AAA family ATPase n=1 Tax=Neorhizobium huautlense TaxID=67774 RepID=UPI000CFA4CFA|nr:AAA family ATPase [Neorhizobium huautlense]